MTFLQSPTFTAHLTYINYYIFFIFIIIIITHTTQSHELWALYEPGLQPIARPRHNPNNPEKSPIKTKVKIYARKYFTTVNNCTIHFLTHKPGGCNMSLTEFFESVAIGFGLIMLALMTVASPFILFR